MHRPLVISRLAGRRDNLPTCDQPGQASPVLGRGFRLTQLLQALADQILPSLARVPDGLIAREQFAGLTVSRKRRLPVPDEGQGLTELDLNDRCFWTILRNEQEGR